MKDCRADKLHSASSVSLITNELWQHITPRRLVQFGVAAIVMLASAIGEIVSLAAVIPFLSVLSDPYRLWQISWIKNVAIKFQITSSQDLLLPTTVVFGLAAVMSAAIRLVSLWLNGRLAAAVGSDLSCEAYRRTLYQPYSVHLQLNSSQVITTVTTQTLQVVAVINAALQLITSLMVAIGLIITLLAINWLMACTSIAVFSLAYTTLSITSKKQLVANSQRVSKYTKIQHRLIQEGLGAIRDILLEGNQDRYLEVYREVDLPMRLRQAQSAFLGTFPRYGLEAISLILISLLALLFASGKGGSTSMLPTLGSMALGAQRLLPSLQQIYSNWALIESRKSAVVDVLGLLDQPVQKVKSNPGYPVFQLVESLRFENVSFSYSQETTRVLNDINLEIRQGERIGLVGSTGSGKSTLVDILMGLLKPTTGKIIINGEDLYDLKEPERLSAWKATIAHVPQSIFMADCSIAENIAFGTPKDKINMDRVRQAAEQAQISSFVETSRDGYHTIVGERGVRMSGGQRQRIGIARAFYRNANLIILDEATSALDRETEQSVIAALENTSQDHTLIMIAHRLSTLEHCDRIIRLGNQSILEIGPPSLVLKSTS